jgi:hypothetical protein
MTRWFVRRNASGAPRVVARIRDEVDGPIPELWNGKEWTYWPAVNKFLFDPLAADPVDEATALAAAQQLSSRG